MASSPETPAGTPVANPPQSNGEGGLDMDWADPASPVAGTGVLSPSAFSEHVGIGRGSTINCNAVLSQLDDVLLGQFGDLNDVELEMDSRMSKAVSSHISTGQDPAKQKDSKKGAVQFAEPALGRPLNARRGSFLEQVAGAISSVTRTSQLELNQTQVGAELSSDSSKRVCAGIAENPIFSTFFMILTFYALFVPDVDMLCGSKGSKYIFSIITFVVCLLFIVELVVQSLGREEYFLRAYFWLDLIAMVSLLPDTWLFNAIFNTNAFVAGRSSRLTRLIRIASRSSKATRLNRLTRIVRVASLMPKISKLLGRKVKDDNTDKMLEKKLLRVFTFLDQDMDGLITLSSVQSCLSKMRADGEQEKTDAKGWKIFRRKTSNHSGDGGSDLSAVSTYKTQKSIYSVATKAPEEPLSPTGLSPMGASPTNKKISGSLGLRDIAEPVSFTDFRNIMLGDSWVENRLRRACQAQLKQGNNMQNLTSRHSEYIAVKVALGVLLLLFVLSMVEPATEDFSSERGLKHITNLVRLRYANQTMGEPIAEEVQQQVDVWRHGAGVIPSTRRILYLDIQKKVYCNEFVEGGQPCLFSNAVDPVWGHRVRLMNVDNDIMGSDFRIDDLSYVLIPNLSDDDLSEDELNERTMSVVVLFIRGETQKVAVMSLLTTWFVIVIILAGIVLLTKDLTFLSRNLLKPLRELADDMESIAQLQLAGVSGVDEALVDEGTSEVRLIRRTFENMKKAIKSWGKYVPWPVVQLLLRANIEANLEVTELEVTVFFSDIAGFTTIVESIPPESSLLLLSRYFNDMSKVIDDHGGVVLEFIGDAIQCIYGAPLPSADHPTSAVKASLRMLACLRRMNDWSKSRQPPLPEVNIRCGVHTGRVLVGNMGFNMGFHSRMKYGIVGEEAHIPARLEEANKTYSTCLLISHSTYSKLSDGNGFVTRPVDYLVLTHKPELIYEVIDRDKRHVKSHPLFPMAKLHTQAMEEYRSRDFKRSAKHFTEVGKMKRDQTSQEDGASDLMLKRCQAYMELPPEEGWDGVWDR